MEVFTELLFGSTIAFTLFLLFVFGLYILLVFALTSMIKKLNMKGAWMIWIPILNFYLIGKIAFENKIIPWLIPIFYILSRKSTASVNNRIINSTSFAPSYLTNTFNFLFALLLIVSLFKVYNKFSDQAIVMTIFTVLSCGILAPVFLFAIRNKEVRA
ncbi:MAG: hypothetical protein PHQ89_00115 [Bacilli bacterium]|nr:hypothetical protein [Bacilli bacterium]